MKRCQKFSEQRFSENSTNLGEIITVPSNNAKNPSIFSKLFLVITYWIDFAAGEGQSFFQKVWTEKNYINLCIEIDCVVYNIKICFCRYVVFFHHQNISSSI